TIWHYPTDRHPCWCAGPSPFTHHLRPPDGTPTSRSPRQKTPPAAGAEAGEAVEPSSTRAFRYQCTACRSRRTGPWHARTRSKSSSRHHSLPILQAGLQVPRAELGLLSFADARRVDYRGPVQQIPALRGVENAPMRDGPPGTRRLREQDGDLVCLDGRVVNGGVFPGSGVIGQLHSFIRVAHRFGEICAIRIRLSRGKTNIQLVRHAQRLATIQRIQNRRLRRIRQSHLLSTPRNCDFVQTRLRHLPRPDGHVLPARRVRACPHHHVYVQHALHTSGRLDECRPYHVLAQTHPRSQLAAAVDAADVPDDLILDLLVTVRRICRRRPYNHMDVDVHNFRPVEPDQLIFASCILYPHLHVAERLNARGNGIVDGLCNIAVGTTEDDDLYAFRGPSLVIKLHRRVLEHSRRTDPWRLQHRRPDAIDSGGSTGG